MALSTAEKTYIRNMTGDTDAADYYNSDDYLQYLYDNKASSDLDKTIVWALRSMCAQAMRKVARTNNATNDTVQSQQEWEHICGEKGLLAQWQNQTGLIPSSVSFSEINLGIDEESSDYSNP